MTDEEDELFEFLELQADVERRHEATTERFKRFLTERGVAFEPPPPDAGSAEVSEAREEQQLWAGRPKAVLTMMVFYKLVMEVLCAEREYMNVEDILQETRQTVVQCLWLRDMWDEPWTSLVDVEFPGHGPTQEDVEGFVQAMADDVAQTWATEQWAQDTKREIESILVTTGYALEPGDEWLIVRLLHAILTRSRYNAREVIRGSSDPEHPAWKVVLDRFVPM